MTQYEVLKFFSELRDNSGNFIFKKFGKKEVFDAPNGEKEELVHSYYKVIKTIKGDITEWFEFRASDHGSSLLRRENQIEHKPWASRRNIDIVFTENGIATCELKATRFFVVEQYVYRYEDMTTDKLNKLVNALLQIGQKDFVDPLGTARYSVIRPVKMDNEDEYIDIPSDESKLVHPHQKEVLKAYNDSKKSQKTNESLTRYVLSFDEFISYNTSYNIPSYL